MTKKLPLFATMGDVLKKSLLEIYSSMGYSLMVSVIHFCGALPMIWAGLALLNFIGKSGPHANLKNIIPLIFPVIFPSLILISVWNALISGPLGVSLYGLYEVRKTDYPNFRMFWDIFRKHYRRTVGVYLVFWLAATLLATNILIALTPFSNLLIGISGLFSFYVLLFLGIMHFYIQPLIYLDNTFKKVFRKSFLLTIDNIGLSFWFGLIFFIVPMMFFVLPTVIPFLIIILMLIYGAFVLYVTNHGFEVIYNKYE